GTPLLSTQFTPLTHGARDPEGALGPYLRAIVGHPLLVALVTLAALGGAIAWLSVREPSYDATAEILVTPLPQGDGSFLGLPFLRESNDPTRTVQTAAAILASSQTASQTADEIGSGYTPQRVSDGVDVEPQGESNILAVTATASDPRIAQGLANAYARAALESRSRLLEPLVAGTIDRLSERQEQFADSGNEQGAADLVERLSQLETVRDGNDPTLSLAQEATLPTDPVGAPPWLVVLLALLGGFTLGTVAALVRELADRHVRDEDEVVSLYPIPILSRVPIWRRRASEWSAASVPPSAMEAYRLLADQVDRGFDGHGRVVMVTSASHGDGKTTSAVSLAVALVAAGRSVVLLDLDLRKPDIARTLQLEDSGGLVELLSSRRVGLRDLTVPAPQVPALKVIPVGAPGAGPGSGGLQALRPRLPEILSEARDEWDYVVVDTAPLGEVSDALTIAANADSTVLVTRPGHTNRTNFLQMRDLLTRGGLAADGFVVLGDSPVISESYYLRAQESNGKSRRSRLRTRA
ncbi:MAG: P-loop NTPase, partial [Actinomycetota bacterium]|nr:P-loop NTPase [Actinomycetota bacterium]